ncbi:MAG: transposase [Acidobacteriota bacterium]
MPLIETMQTRQKSPTVILTHKQREIVAMAIHELCAYRQYQPLAVNPRSNHVHAVIAAQTNPDRIVNDLKAYAKRALRRAQEFDPNKKVWSR